MIKRKLFKSLKKHLKQKEITLLVGPRQAGKTTLLLMLKEYLAKRGEKTVFFNLDIEDDRRYFHSQTEFLNKVKLEIGENEGFIFIDEIQQKENAGIFLKGIYDMNTIYKFIVSGSGSVELKEKIHESLTGRKRLFELTTLSFEEFVNFKTNYAYEDKLKDFFTIDKDKVNILLKEYLNFGGYPRVVLESRLEEKRLLINEIYKSYIEKDISYLLKVKKADTFSNLVRLLASQTGKITNYNELSSNLGLAHVTLREYLHHLEKTFILRRISPFFKNIKKEIRRAPVFYFYDLGLRNFSVSEFGNLYEREAAAFVFQNFVCNILIEKIENTGARLFFWRTKDKAEVDFVIDRGLEQIPIEVKFQRLKFPKIPIALRNFIKRYQPEKAYIVNLELRETLEIKKTKVFFIPYTMLLFEKF